MGVTAKARVQYAPSSFGFDWLMSLLAVALVAGVFQDGWAHDHGKVDESFFTPWHAVLYGMMALNGIVLGAFALHNVSVRKYPPRYALPFAYLPALLGVAVFAIGGLIDLWWHNKFGIEADLEALVSPSHLVLAAGASLILTAPLRSVTSRVGPDGGGWRRIGPAILSAAAMMGVIGFFTVYTNPNGNDYVRHIIAPPLGPRVTSGIYVSRDDGSNQKLVSTSSDADSFVPAISRDGTQLAFSRSPLKSDAADILVTRTTGAGAKAIVADGRRNLFPVFSPDGTRLAFVSSPAGTSGNFRLRVVDADGTHASTLLEQTALIANPAWTPDGNALLFTTRRGVDTEIARIGVTKRDVAFIDETRGGGYPAVSHDGTFLAYIKVLGRRSRLAVVPLAGGAARIVTDHAFATPVWSPDGRRIMFTSLTGDDTNLAVVNADGSGRRDVAVVPGFSASHPSWARSGTIVFSARANEPQERTRIATYFVESNNLVNAVILAGFGLLLVRRFQAPFGALTVLFTVYGILMATQEDTYFIIPVLVITGLIGDVAVSVLQHRIRGGAWFYALGFAWPLLYFALFLAATDETTGLDWAPNLVFGSPVLAGVAGLFIAFCFDPPLSLRREAA